MGECVFRSMGSEVAVVLAQDVVAGSEWAGWVGDFLAQVPVWFEQWEQVFSRFRSDSELSGLNRHVGDWCRVSDVMWEVLVWADRCARDVQGLVSPCVLQGVVRCGYGGSFEGLDVSELQMADVQVVGGVGSGVDGVWGDVSLDDWVLDLDVDGRRVRVPGAGLDLGGFVKGWCADEVVRRWLCVCERWVDAPALLVDVGGDVRSSAAMRDGVGWPIGVAYPVMGGGSVAVGGGADVCVVGLSGGGVATSGQDFRRWMHEGQVRHHIVDPRSGVSAVSDVLSVSVLAPLTRQAEVLAKLLLILGFEAGCDWLERSRLGAVGVAWCSDWSVCWVLMDGSVRMNAAFERCLLR